MKSDEINYSRKDRPQKDLDSTHVTLRYPKYETVPRHQLSKPANGSYNLVRLIRSDLKLNIFGELFPVSDDLMYQYVVATIDVKDQKMRLFHSNLQVEEYEYKLR